MPGIILIYKKTFLQSYGSAETEAKLRSAAPELFQQMNEAHEEHLQSVERLIRVLEKEDLPFAAYERSEDAGDLERADLVVTLGGDGTFIHSSHRLKTTPILGLNSAPRHSVGHYCIPCPQDDDALAQFLHEVFEGRTRRKYFPRLDLIFDGRPLGIPVLNDLLICDAIPAATSRYLLCFHDGKQLRREIQKSSGVWIATRSGSTAAYRSAGGHRFPPQKEEHEKLCAFAVREIYDRSAADTLGAFLPEPTLPQFELISAMAHGRVFIDGTHGILEFPPGSHLQLQWFAHELVALQGNKSHN